MHKINQNKENNIDDKICSYLRIQPYKATIPSLSGESIWVEWINNSDKFNWSQLNLIKIY